MTTYNRPGVYVNELPLAAAPINGAISATAAGACIGAFAQGPDTITLVNSWYEFTKRFGGYDSRYPASFAVGSFFANGGTELYVKRVLPYAAQKVAKVAVPAVVLSASKSLASYSVTDNVVTLVTSSAHGITDAAESITVAGVTGSGNTFLNGTYTITGRPTTSSVTFAATHVDVESTSLSAGTLAYSYSDGASVTFAAKHRGIDGNNIRVQLTKSSVVHTDGYYDLSVFYEAGVADTIVDGVVTANGETDTLVERFTGLVLNDANSGDYIVTVLEFGSAYVRVLEGAVAEYDENGDLISPEVSYSVGVNPVVDNLYALSGAPAPEVSLTYRDYTGNTVYDPSGDGEFTVDDCTLFSEFETIDRPLVFFLPDVTTKVATAPDQTPEGWDLSKYVYNALLEWVDAPKTNGMHFVVVETAGGLSVDEALSASGDLIPSSSRAAVYFPHIYIKDPVGRSGAAVRKIGPAGAVVGQFLTTDHVVGPFKTPAGINTKVVDAIGIEKAFSPSELDALNSGVKTTGVRTGVNVVNAIRNIPGAGVVIMGGRTLKQDGTANRYVAMRRSLTYIEKRLNDLASFAVFENNTEVLWARLITVIGGFLNEYRNQGGLRGTTIDESYYIKCDAENNTAATIAAGEVHVEIGVALEYPAEFVVINLSQKTAE